MCQNIPIYSYIYIHYIRHSFYYVCVIHRDRLRPTLLIINVFSGEKFRYSNLIGYVLSWKIIGASDFILQLSGSYATRMTSFRLIAVLYVDLDMMLLIYFTNNSNINMSFMFKYLHIRVKRMCTYLVYIRGLILKNFTVDYIFVLYNHFH